jgi:hypothetical protein
VHLPVKEADAALGTNLRISANFHQLWKAKGKREL